jgi:hypothetical protein
LVRGGTEGGSASWLKAAGLQHAAQILAKLRTDLASRGGPYFSPSDD